jgi:hypothetical protein
MICSWLSRELGNFSREFYELTMPDIDMFEDGNDLVVKIDLAGPHVVLNLTTLNKGRSWKGSKIKLQSSPVGTVVWDSLQHKDL